jgi:competence protein ComEA
MSTLAPRPSLPPAHTGYDWRLRHADQTVVAVSLLLALTAMCGSWITSRNRLVEADKVQRHVARFQVDPNIADLAELECLPGVGDVLGRRIIDRRQSVGPFTEPDDLRSVKGIGPKIMERIRPYLLPPNKDEKQDK